MNEITVRAGSFVAVFALVALWELLARRRVFAAPRRRWPLNLGLMLLGALLVRALLPLAAIGVAAAMAEHDIGLFNLTPWPAWLEVLLAVLLLDLAIYAQHVLFHAVPALWRLHRVHHADPVFDVSTGVRFHPLEILLSMLIKMALVAALGAPALAVLVFEVLLSAGALFTHANAGLPAGLDRRARWLLVTPDMHRIHHSQARVETDSNYGFNLALWDRLFGTYRAQPAAGRDAMAIGLAEVPVAAAGRLGWCLGSPFARPPSRPDTMPEGRQDSR